jgi:hypothetical protein
MESLKGLLIKGWNTAETKKKPNNKECYKILYILRHADALHQSMEILPGFAIEDEMICDWERKNKMPCFKTFDYGNNQKDQEIIAWKPFPELSKELKKLIWHRPIVIRLQQ